MRLKRLELYGYKSFASRCVFEFSSGITAIVGPNGSGKSNVADAVRWVLGEQSYSSLRARRTEDMIFAGAGKRSRLGMAEVILTLDNADGWLPIDYTEVTIGRRAYRSGENEYLLNGNRVRHRDIIDLLGSAGVSPGAYIVIGQGLVDAALSLTPEARRVLFEEAAGIAPQLRKRQETLDRIQETQRNLERVEDILNELRPRARALRRQAERAEEHLLLSQDLRELQRIWFGYQWQSIQQKLVQAEGHLRVTREQLEAQHNYSRELQARQTPLREAQEQQSRIIEALAERLGALRDQAEALRRELAVSTERSRQYEQQRASLEQDQEALLSRRAILATEVERSAAELAEQQTARQRTSEALAQARQELEQLDGQRHAVEAEIRELERKLAEGERAQSRQQARLDQLGERRRELAREQDELAARHTQAEQRLASLQRQTQELQVREREIAAQREALEQAQEEAERQVLATRDELAAAEQQAAEMRSERDHMVGRRRSLERLREQLSDYHPGVREVLRAAERIGGVRGTVASLMRVPRAYEQAVEAALGARVQNIVTERWEDAEAGVALLKQSRAGWATFLPLDTLRPPTPLRPRQGEGVVGVASELVEYDPELKPVFDLLLGRILIVEDLPAARRLLRERTGASLLVTLEGETVQPSGALSGGARRGQSPLLAQEREWRELPGRIRAAEARLAEAAEVVAAQQGYLEDLRQQIRQRSQELAATRQALEQAHQAATRQGDEVSRAERERGWVTLRGGQVTGEMQELETRESALAQERQALQQAREELERTLLALREQAAAAQNQALRERVGELETQAQVSSRITSSLERLLASHQANLADLERQMQERAGQQTALALRQQELVQGLAAEREHLQALEQELAETRARIEPEREKRAELEREHGRVVQQYNDSLERLHEAETGHNQALLERDRARDQQANLSGEIEEALGPIDLPDVIAHQLRLSLDDNVVELPRVPVLPPGLNDEIRHLRSRLRRIGSVNVDAPREYEKLLERQTFLQSQVSDLRGAIASLHEVIEELDQVIEQDLRRTIREVDEGFRHYFEILFGGGAAQLVLTDPDNMATTGVDIIASPPGKRAQRLSLLSGGERSLTATALLFALLRANPVPFCFLDEVDAALDEANVGRFRDLLQEHALGTQFVVITHNRRTIEAAATIYGISMEERGVSQSISLQVEGREV
jgi:chromosome segregation protein